MAAEPKVLARKRWDRFRGSGGIGASDPQRWFSLSGRMLPWFAAASLVFALLGAYGALSGPPGPGGGVQRILWVHLPAAWLAMALCLAMAAAACAGALFDRPVASMLASALAPTGAMLALLALWTGALWSKPIWGTWWMDDPQPALLLLLLGLFLIFIALQEVIDDDRLADKAAALLGAAGMVVVPAVHLAALWWLADHPGAAGRATAPRAADAPAGPLVLLGLALLAYCVSVVLVRLRCVILERQRRADWVAQLDVGREA